MSSRNCQTRSPATEFCVLVINSSGNSTKTITGRGLLRNRMLEPSYYRVGYNDRNIRGEEIFIAAHKLEDVHKALMTSMSVIVEVEVSAFEETINQMNSMVGCHEDYDFVLIPVINSSYKLIDDSIRTIETLISMGVSRDKFKILFNRAVNGCDFELLTNKLKELKITYDLNAQIENHEFYEKLDILGIKYNDITEDKLRADEKKLKQLEAQSTISHLLINTTFDASKAYFSEAVPAQKDALQYSHQHDEVFDMLFGHSHSAS